MNGRKLTVMAGEFLPARVASRELGRMIEKLKRNEVNKFVIVNRNEPQAVLITVESYSELMRPVEPREGMVTVYDSQNRYVGCMGEETWRRTLGFREEPRQVVS